MSAKLSKKILLPIIGILAVTIIGISIFLSILVNTMIEEQVTSEKNNLANSVQDQISIINTLVNQQVSSGISLLKEGTTQLGAATIEQGDATGITDVTLKFGTTAINNNFELVDDIKSNIGGTSTIFVKSGSSFIRVSTNVKKDDGSRAIGTELDPKGAAYKVISEGSAFHGMVFILGKPFIAGYEPIKDNSGEVVGIYYTGYPVESLELLKESIRKSKVLEEGYVALYDNKGNLIEKSENVSQEIVTTNFKDTTLAAENDWVVSNFDIDVWKFTLVIAYNQSEVNSIFINRAVLLITIIILGGLLISLFVAYSIKRFVVSPINETLVMITGLSAGRLEKRINVASDDEVGQMSSEMNTLANQLTMFTNTLNELSRGNFNVTVNTLGEGDQITPAFQKIVSTLVSLKKETDLLISAAARGELSYRGNQALFTGGYQEIIQGFNKTLENIMNPLKDSNDVLSQMATGDLRVRINSDYQGDFKILKESVNALGESLSQLVFQVTEAVNATASASEEISSSTEQMATGAMEQTAQTSEVAAAVEEMTSTIQETTKNTGTAVDLAKAAGDLARKGGEVVQKTVEGMITISKVVNRAAETVTELGNSSSQIGEIVQVINDIADQTNLLALNAAIEAARAGEQGRGFAVVADEVRKLAERTTKATAEIATMIKKIQKDTGEAVDSIRLGTKEVEQGKILSEQAGSSMSQIVESTVVVIDTVTQIATASEEQSSTAVEISKSLDTINNVAQESSNGIQQIARAAEDLSGLTSTLLSLVEQFKIETKSTAKSLSSSRQNKYLN